MKMKNYDAEYDYLQDLTEEELKVKDGKEFVYLRGLEKLARARGVVSKHIRVHATPTSENPIAVVSVQYTFKDGAIWESTADCTSKSAKEGFGKYLTAMAESRAKARALRDAFGITLCSVEEIGTPSASIDEEEDSPPISDPQKYLIGNLLKEKGKSLDDCRILLKVSKLDSIDGLTKIQAGTLIRKLQGDKK